MNIEGNEGYNMRAIIIDDEPIAIQMFERLIADITQLDLVASTTNATQALPLITTHLPDVVFLDIDLGIASGLEIADRINEHFPHIKIVFITAFSDYAVQAFELNAIDYLLKPVQQKRIVQMMTKLSQASTKQAATQQTIHIKTMYQGRMLDQDGSTIKVRTEKVEELFYYLWYHRSEAITRELILDALWTDLAQDKAVNLMHSTLYQLRKTLDQLGYDNAITLKSKQYVLNVDVTSDYNELIHLLVQPTLTEKDVIRLLDLYRGDFFEVQNYHWAHFEREKLREDITTSLLHYVTTETCTDNVMIAILALVKKLELYDEEWVLAIMAYFATHHKQTKLIHFYNEVKSHWQNELGLDLPKAIQNKYVDYII